MIACIRGLESSDSTFVYKRDKNVCKNYSGTNLEWWERHLKKRVILVKFGVGMGKGESSRCDRGLGVCGDV